MRPRRVFRDGSRRWRRPEKKEDGGQQLHVEEEPNDSTHGFSAHSTALELESQHAHGFDPSFFLGFFLHTEAQISVRKTQGSRLAHPFPLRVNNAMREVRRRLFLEFTVVVRE